MSKLLSFCEATGYVYLELENDLSVYSIQFYPDGSIIRVKNCWQVERFSESDGKRLNNIAEDTELRTLINAYLHSVGDSSCHSEIFWKIKNMVKDINRTL